MEIEDLSWPPRHWGYVAAELEKGEIPNPQHLALLVEIMDEAGPPPRIVAEYIAKVVREKAPRKKGKGAPKKGPRGIDHKYNKMKNGVVNDFENLKLQGLSSEVACEIIADQYRKSPKWVEQLVYPLNKYSKTRLHLIEEFVELCRKGASEAEAVVALAERHNGTAQDVMFFLCHPSYGRPGFLDLIED